MARKGRARLRRLTEVVVQAHPDLVDPVRQIQAGRVAVDGRIVNNPASLVRADATIALVRETALRGEAKLAAALERFEVRVHGRIALDLGAAAGGFTRVLLGAGAARVYAVDAGFGQLLGSLRQDRRVVNLERTNLGELEPSLVPDEVDVVTFDLSYLPLALAVPQVSARLRFAADADLIALVKPQFELSLPGPPPDDALGDAVAVAIRGVACAGWAVRGTMESPARGSGGAVEFLLHATRG
jgi:23S rRNA (cytidine1920-2'-O)/16S rRNA (cytidine1409-2'-O)-methyltransferase